MSKAQVVLKIHAGRDRAGNREGFDTLDFLLGQVVALVGPTGSGKTRFLADVERLSPGDSPTGRRVVLVGLDSDGAVATSRISQTMQFFLDLTVAEFIQMHAEARCVVIDPEEVCRWTNLLAGEPVSLDQPLASLSGGQARALMVADVVLVSRAPIVLIDEIENAGIDRHAALKFLIKKDKLVFVATHDPLIALRCDLRLVMARGGVQKVVHTTPQEKRIAQRLAAQDRRLLKLRNAIRLGHVIGDPTS